MSRLNRLALVSALVFAAAPALAYEPELVGLDYTPSPAISLGAASGDRAVPSAPGWEPEILGVDDATYASGYVSQEAVDPIALIDPAPGSGPVLAAASTATAPAAALAAASAGAANGQLACNCPCK